MHIFVLYVEGSTHWCTWFPFLENLFLVHEDDSTVHACVMKKMMFQLWPRFWFLFATKKRCCMFILGLHCDWLMYMAMLRSDWLSHGWPRVDCQHINGTLRFMQPGAIIQIVTEFESWLCNFFKCHFVFLIFPPWIICMLHLCFLLFFQLYKIIENRNSSQFFALCSFFCLLFFDHFSINCAWLNIFWC